MGIQSKEVENLPREQPVSVFTISDEFAYLEESEVVETSLPFYVPFNSETLGSKIVINSEVAGEQSPLACHKEGSVSRMQESGNSRNKGFAYWLREVPDIQVQPHPTCIQGKGRHLHSVAGNLALGLDAGVPWIMCKQKDAPAPVSSSLDFINPWNGRQCGVTFTGPNSPEKPTLWNENRTAHIMVVQALVGLPQRSPQLATMTKLLLMNTISILEVHLK
ncbi:hypothetical protein RJ641_013691 [Dillenia turbinata]|uniref:Beta-galactosidase n=1 Tax=Dillenia turbinata TaxID=194707 RepID=A0AAN8WD65_9MAGN